MTLSPRGWGIQYMTRVCVCVWELYICNNASGCVKFALTVTNGTHTELEVEDPQHHLQLLSWTNVCHICHDAVIIALRIWTKTMLLGFFSFIFTWLYIIKCLLKFYSFGFRHQNCFLLHWRHNGGLKPSNFAGFQLWINIYMSVLLDLGFKAYVLHSRH